MTATRPYVDQELQERSADSCPNMENLTHQLSKGEFLEFSNTQHAHEPPHTTF